MKRIDLDLAPRDPIIYTPAPLVDFILQFCETSRPGTLLIVCTDQQSFLKHLTKSTLDQAKKNGDDEGVVEAQQRTSPSHPLLDRTLRLLAISRHIELAFCPSVTAFHAYVSTISLKPKKEKAQTSEPPSLAILNLVRMHRPTASYSAQGLGKAFATAVEAAWQSKSRLVLFEYSEAMEDNTMMTESYESDPVNEFEDERDEQEGDEQSNARRARSTHDNIWQEQVPILNATTKTFGNLGDRGWMGRAIQIIDVAARWCTVQQLSNPS